MALSRFIKASRIVIKSYLFVDNSFLFKFALHIFPIKPEGVN